VIPKTTNKVITPPFPLGFPLLSSFPSPGFGFSGLPGKEFWI
jgi:hypothetical protein